MLKSQIIKKKLPETPGVYLFIQNKDIIYIGKATSLKERIQSYFGGDLIQTRGPLLVDMIQKATRLEFIKTDSVLEAIILEVNLIKKYQPKYNTKEKDNKSFNYVIITKEDWPRVLTIRGRDLAQKIKELDLLTYFGPFPNTTQLKNALKIIRRIFPFRDKCSPGQGRSCFNKQLGLCPGICDNSISEKDYNNIIKNIILFFEGKKKQIIKNLNKEMESLAKKREYEKAGIIRNKIFSLNHIQDVAIIASEATIFSPPQLRRGDYSDNRGGCLRIEAYDASHLSGTNNVGVMVVMEDGEFKKSDYRKFKIRESKGNDAGALKEILERRLKHTEWPKPDLIVVDGGMAQLNVAKKILTGKGSTLNLQKGRTLRSQNIISVTKDDKHRPKAIIGNEDLVKKYQKEILLINNEAHRFVIAFHRQKRSATL